MSYQARIYTNQASAEGATVTVFDRGTEEFLNPVYYDPYNSGGEYRTLYDYAEFGVDLDPGYEFVQWVYRVGSETAEVQYSYNNPFIYREMEYIVIRPEVQYTGGGGGGTVPVFIDFTTDQIERMRFYYYDGSGEEVSSDYIYGPEYLYVETNSWLTVRNMTIAVGASPPVYCTMPDGTQQMIIDENDNWFDRDIYIDDWGGTYWFHTDSGGGGDDYGDFVERTVYVTGQKYVPYVSDGGSWYKHKTVIAE